MERSYYQEQERLIVMKGTNPSIVTVTRPVSYWVETLKRTIGGK